MQCDICGKDAKLVKILVENSKMNVCLNCSGYGAIVHIPKKIIFKPKPVISSLIEPEYTLKIVDNYSALIKNKRESLCLKQEDLAKNLNEKWSIIQKIESNNFKPSLDLTRKLERFLKIRLIEQVQEENIEITKDNSVLTIGDMLKQKLSLQ
ncbi:TIGR00270 family protein [Candidatus Woesearchaeota archaeon]|nr:TIGR00270 family protein [Candidatus Woesearchaeota archaeon]